MKTWKTWKKREVWIVGLAAYAQNKVLCLYFHLRHGIDKNQALRICLTLSKGIDWAMKKLIKKV